MEGIYCREVPIAVRPGRENSCWYCDICRDQNIIKKFKTETWCHKHLKEHFLKGDVKRYIEEWRKGNQGVK